MDPNPPPPPAPDSEPAQESPQVRAARIKAKRQASARANGIHGGMPAGKVISFAPEDTAKLIENAAASVLAGGSGLRRNLSRVPLTEKDREHFNRFANLTADEFTAQLSQAMRTLADMTAVRIHEHLTAGNYKPNELTFLLTVLADKLHQADGRAQISNANVAIQINNYGPRTREQVLAEIRGESLPPPAPTLRL